VPGPVCTICGGDHDDEACPVVLDNDAGRFVGSVLGPYRVLEHVGAGAMSSVYRAQHTDTGQNVALKVLIPSEAPRKNALSRLLREAAAIRKINHPNVVSVVDFGTDGQAFYLAMELLDGMTLEQMISLQGHIELEAAVRIAKQISEGLTEVHRLGFVHRDLKPGNVMLVGTGTEEQAKILDFGLVGIIGDADVTRVTQQGFTLGTPAYMAPEQLSDARVGPQADLYSLGLVIHEMLTGAPPFMGPLREVISRQLVEKPPPLGELSGLGPLVARLLEKRPDDRPKDARAVTAELGMIRTRLEKTVVDNRSFSGRTFLPSVTPIEMETAVRSDLDRTVADASPMRLSAPTPLPVPMLMPRFASSDDGRGQATVVAPPKSRNEAGRSPSAVPTVPPPPARGRSSRSGVAGLLDEIGSLRAPAIAAAALLAAALSAVTTVLVIQVREAARSREAGEAGARDPNALSAQLEEIEVLLRGLGHETDARQQTALWREYAELSRSASKELLPEEVAALSSRIRDLATRARSLAAEGRGAERHGK
jgi:serine/threonine protein kinase